jgi:uncharacterized protein (DUF697 family)
MSERTTPKPALKSVEQELSEAIVSNYMVFTGAAGIIPVPIIDTAAIAALQFSMLSKIGEKYGYSLSKHWGKSIIGALVGGYTATALGNGIGMRIARSIPFVGGIASIIVVPAFAAASTWALGQIFILHFESGGSFADFDPTLAKDSYNELVKKGEKVVEDMKAEKKAASGAIKEAAEHHEVAETTTHKQHK